MDMEKRWEDLFDEQTLSSIFEGLLLLGTAGIAYKEHQRAKAEQQHHNEELKELFEKVTAIREEQLQQTQCMDEERKRWEAEKTSLEAEMKKLRSSLESKQKDYDTLRKRLAAKENEVSEKERDVKSAKQELDRMRESYQKERNETEQQHLDALNALEEKNRAALDSAKQQQKEALDSLKQEHESEKERIRLEDKKALEKAVEEYREIHADWDLYHRYKTWFRENMSRIRLNDLECGSFTGFIGCCNQVDTLHYIYQELESQNLWNWSQQDVNMMEEVINCCCKLQNLDRLKPEVFYNPACHYKPEDGPSSGYVDRVLLAGVEKNGVMLEDCKSFIKIATN